MFGSKLRSWMENHIVRPRKKGNKNKSGNNGNNFGVLTTQNGYGKSGSFAADSNIGSPARRSEVSPIQSHTTSRRGWHSPNQDNVPISPKSDHYPAHHRIHSRQAHDGGAQYWTNAYGTVNGQSGPSSIHHQQQQQQQFNPGVSSPKSISRNGSSYTLESGPTNIYYSKSVDSYAVDGALPYAMPEFDFHAGNAGPPRGIMTGAGSVSAGHNGHLMTVHTPTVTRSTYSTATSSSNELLEELHPFEGARIKRLHPAATRISSSSSSSVNSTHYGVNGNHNNNNHLASGTLPTHYGSSNGHHQQARSQAVVPSASSENKYGKLLQQQNSSSKQYGPYYEQQHNGNNNSLHYSSNGSAAPNSTNGDGGAGSRNASPLPARGSSACTSPVLRSAAPSVKSNRIINGNNNNNNNNSIHLDGSASGGTNGKTNVGGSSLTASFTSKFHKLTGHRSNAPEGGNTNASNTKLNHVNNNNNSTITLHHVPGNSTSAGSYHHHHHQQQHQYQINNVTTHLHPTAQPLPSGKQQPLSSSSSSSSPPPPPPGAQAGGHGPAPSPGVHHLHHPSTHGHHHHHPHGPMGHTLSSPESAYSTGYSTDGTSPGGCSYTPEYYINIRTGTHYFPKGTTLPGALHGRTAAAFDRTGSAIVPSASSAGNHHENGSKFKCALNRIEEKHVEFCVDGETHVVGSRACATPTPAAPNLSSFKPTSGAAGGGPAGGNGPAALSQLQQQPSVVAPQQPQQPNQPPNAVAMSPIMQKNLGMQHYRSIESPSPRQRCRIRTNPWLTTADGALASANCIKRTEQDSGSTSSGIKSSSGTDDNKNDNNKPNALSDTDSSSSTEKIVNKKPFTPKSLKKMSGDISRLDSKSAPVTHGSNQDSDEDATLNEMMGKFDESYHYEKETDILSCSDSDPTDCPTDIDTGQDAGDECDTDDLLDLDFIDTGSVQEVPDKETYRHTASCSIHHFPERKASCKQQRSQRSKRTNECGGGSKRRKKLVRTRKKTSDQSSALGMGDGTGVVSRGCRSLGGTPVSLRRNQPDPESRTPTTGSPLTNRCNSLTFTEVHSLHSRILAISESEKALLRADLEADVKYKQLIHEAESILFSMKSNSSICIKDLTTVPPPLPPREPQPPSVPSLAKETPTTATSTIASPRRVCNPPANKRVEMLRNCEADLRRELAKTCSQKCTDGVGNTAELNPVEGVIVNKRLEVLRYETSCSLSAPNSPKNTRVLLPRKTHVTNFIHHQARAPCSSEANQANDLKQSANLSPPPPPPRRLMSKSPTIMRRRFRSQSPHLNIESDSDSDEVSRNLDSKTNGKMHRANHNNKENLTSHPQPVCFPQPPPRNVAGKQMNNYRHTIHGPALVNGEDAANGYDGNTVEGIPNGNPGSIGMHKSPLISFRSVDIGSPVTDDSYCPQSEPLKRKIYTCSAAFEKIQRSLHHDPDAKQQLIIDALAEIKRSLEDQSVELHELNNTEN